MDASHPEKNTESSALWDNTRWGFPMIKVGFQMAEILVIRTFIGKTEEVWKNISKELSLELFTTQCDVLIPPKSMFYKRYLLHKLSIEPLLTHRNGRQLITW